MGKKVKGISVRFVPERKKWGVFCVIGRDRWRGGSFSTKELADDVAKEYGRRLAAGEDIRPAKLRAPKPEPAVEPGSVRDVGDRWLVDRQTELKGTSNDLYDINLHQHVYPLIGTQQIGALDRDACKAFAKSLIGRVSERTGRPLMFGTRVTIVATLSSLCTWAIEQKHLNHNPCIDVRRFTIDRDELTPTMVVWTHEQAARFLKTVQKHAPHYYAFFYVLLRTGLRAGEIVELQWDLDFTIPGYVLVQRQYQARPRVKLTLVAGRRVRTPMPNASRITTPKGKRLRRVTLRPDVIEVLKRHKVEEWERAMRRAGKTVPALAFAGPGALDVTPRDTKLALVAGKKRGAAVEPKVPVPALTFTGPRGTRVDVKSLEQRLLEDLCIKAKVPVTTKLHTTRHTFATVLLMAGEDLEYVSTQLGHSDTATTERHYKHYIPDDRRDKERGARIDAAWAVTPAAAEGGE